MIALTLDALLFSWQDRCRARHGRGTRRVDFIAYAGDDDGIVKLRGISLRGMHSYDCPSNLAGIVKLSAIFATIAGALDLKQP